MRERMEAYAQEHAQIASDRDKWKAAAEAWTVMVDDQAAEIAKLKAELGDMKNERDDIKKNLWAAQDDNTSLFHTLHSIVQVRGEAPNEYLVYKRLPMNEHYDAVIAFLKGHPHVDDKS